MLQITLQNVRTFVGLNTVELRPLTILTGENSSGKTTFLGMVSAVCEAASFPFAPDFNRAPFSLGTYDTIATYKGGKFGRAKSFSIGYVTDVDREDLPRTAIATYRNIDGQPHLSRFEAIRNGSSILLDANESTPRSFAGSVTIRGGDNPEFATKFAVPRALWTDRRISIADLLIGDAQWALESGEFSRRLDALANLRRIGLVFAPMGATPIAPIRSQPERIYGQLSDVFRPSGDHIPFVLDRLLREESSTPESRLVSWALSRFGEESGLFKNLKVKKLGSKPEDPFQLLVSMGGREANLVDVGYGVSQALPVIVESALAPSTNLVLLQQPEVHLHPRGQAALGTYFAELVSSAAKNMIIETHSDFLIDRVRQEVAGGRLHPEAVALLFFERIGFETTVHQLRLDSAGNIQAAPSSYRSFFLEEELRLLSR